MLQLLSYVIFTIIIFADSNCSLNEDSNKEINCFTDEGNIWNVDVKKRFIRTFHNFSSFQLEHDKLNYRMRVCDLVLNFELDNEVYSEWFQLKRLRKNDGVDYFLVEHLKVKSRICLKSYSYDD